MIILSIDARKIDKKRLKEVTKRDGTVASYLELVLIDTPNGQYGDFIVKQGVTQEERKARVEMPILGNGKHVGGQNRPSAAPRGGPSAKHSGPPEPEPPADDEIPF